MQHLLKLDKDLLEHSDDRGYTALHHATLNGFEDTVHALLDAGADVNLCSAAEHGPALHLAVIKGRASLVDFPLENRAQVNRPNEALGSPLHCAAFSGNRSIADALTRKGAMLEASAKVSMPEMRALSGIPGEKSDTDLARVCECQPFIVAAFWQSREIFKKCIDSIPCIDQEFQTHGTEYLVTRRLCQAC